MPDVRIVWSIVSDDGSDGVFWRNGERWTRENGQEQRIKDLSPHLEEQFEKEQLSLEDLGMQTINRKAQLKSLEG